PFVPDTGPPPPAPSGPGTNLARFFLTENGAQHLLAAAQGSGDPFIGGDVGLGEVARSLVDLAASGTTGDFIYMLNWHCEHTLELDPKHTISLPAGVTGTKLMDLLGDAARKGVQIRAMFWGGNLLPDLPVLLLVNPELFILYEAIRFLVSFVK